MKKNQNDEQQHCDDTFGRTLAIMTADKYNGQKYSMYCACSGTLVEIPGLC